MRLIFRLLKKYLKDVIEFLNNKIKILPEKTQNIKEENIEDGLDFSEVKGQEFVKRGLEIAVAGSHNVCLIGFPRIRKNNACRTNTKYNARFKF